MLCLTNLCSENKHVKHLQPKKERGEGLLDSVNNHLSAFINKLPFLTTVFSCFIEQSLNSIEIESYVAICDDSTV